MAYTKQQFEAAFQLITAVSHQMIKIDFKEVETWVDKLMGPEALTDEQRKDNMNRLKEVLQQFGNMQQVLLQFGVPVRDIEHYREEHPAEGVPDHVKSAASVGKG
jgi:hypothetical protein